jgi:hypothetical protein
MDFSEWTNEYRESRRRSGGIAQFSASHLNARPVQFADAIDDKNIVRMIELDLATAMLLTSIRKSDRALIAVGS